METINGIKITNPGGAEAYAIEKMGKDATRRFVDIAYSQWFNRLKAEYTQNTPTQVTVNGIVYNLEMSGMYLYGDRSNDKRALFVSEDASKHLLIEQVNLEDKSELYAKDINTYEVIKVTEDGEIHS